MRPLPERPIHAITRVLRAELPALSAGRVEPGFVAARLLRFALETGDVILTDDCVGRAQHDALYQRWLEAETDLIALEDKARAAVEASRAAIAQVFESGQPAAGRVDALGQAEAALDDLNREANKP